MECARDKNILPANSSDNHAFPSHVGQTTGPESRWFRESYSALQNLTNTPEGKTDPLSPHICLIWKPSKFN